jgi:hypothetical protein
MADYPVDTVLIMTDDIFVMYGGETGTSMSGQRQAAYYIAEEAMSRHLQCLLNPLTITEPVYPTLGGTTELNWGRVHDVYSIKITDNRSVSHVITGTQSSPIDSWVIRDSLYGHVDVNNAIRKFLGYGYEQYSNYGALNVELTYNSGLPTGTAMRPNMLNALTILSDIALKEMSALGLNESVGDVGVKIFASNGYQEQRVDLIRTALGTSARAQYARKLVNNLKLTKAYLFR